MGYFPDEPIMQFFAYEHLPEHLQSVSAPFGLLARQIVETLPRNPERTVALRKLLEAKDAAVRAKLFRNRVQNTGYTGPVYKNGVEVDPLTDEPIEIINADIDVDGPPDFG